MMIAITGIVIVRDTSIDASYAGLAMTFISGITLEILFLVRRFVALEQSMVAVSQVSGQRPDINAFAGRTCQRILRAPARATRVC
jgi:hypothetical protein